MCISIGVGPRIPHMIVKFEKANSVPHIVKWPSSNFKPYRIKIGDVQSHLVGPSIALKCIESSYISGVEQS